MGQVLHGSATTTEAVRRAIQHSQESVRALAERNHINPKTVSKWKLRETVVNRKTGPKEPRSTVLTPEEEAVVVAFRRYTLLPLDDCLYGLQPTIPHLTRSSLHLGFQRHGIERLPDVEGNKAPKKKFKAYPIGYFHIRCPLVVCLANHERGYCRSEDGRRQASSLCRHRPGYIPLTYVKTIPI